MKRNEIVTSLLKEGFSEKTLLKFNDKQLNDLAVRIFSEETVNIPKDDVQSIEAAKKEKKPFITYEQEVDEELKGEQTKIDKNKNGKIDAEDFKLLKKKKKKENIKEWVSSVTNKNFHSFTSKNEIMEMIEIKLQEAGPNVKIGHNGTPEFMTYEGEQPSPSKPGTDAPVREKPLTKPGRPERENPFKPKHKPKPKASSEDNLPEFLKFDNLGIKFKK